MKVISNCPIPIKGSERWNELTESIRDWNKASSGTLNETASAVYHNAAEEARLERDEGIIAHINVRIG